MTNAAKPKRWISSILFWLGLVVGLCLPILAAANSPLLQWRSPVYIAAGFAGVVAFALLLLQPLAAGGYLPGLSPMRARMVHRVIGLSLISMIVIHVGALWITSPPDVIDALLFVSPTPFSLWGVIAMWSIFATGLLALFRRSLRMKPKTWRRLHTALALIIAAGTVAHALLIEGTMEHWTKIGLSILVIVATVKVVLDLRLWFSSAR